MRKPRLIDISELPNYEVTFDGGALGESAFEGVGRFVLLPIEHLTDLPTVDAAPVVHGRWMTEKTGKELFDYRFQCSECRNYTPDKAYAIAPDFCPACGAKMDGGVADDYSAD